MFRFASRMDNMARSAAVVRDLFGSMTDPALISFGGGAPAKDTLPVEAMRDICAEVLSRDLRGLEALQYGPPAGLPQLRELVASELLASAGLRVSPEQVMIVAGGLETANLLCQLFIEPGDVILVESPTFVHCVEVFEMFGARCIGCESDEHGLITDALEALIERHNPRMIYTIPTFQNPSGTTLALQRREKLAALCSEHRVMLFEDDPYRELRYEGDPLPYIKSFDQTGHTVLAGSFSKIFAPGIRLGFAVADRAIIDRLFDAKTATNSHSNMVSQVVCAEFLARGLLPAHLAAVRALHKERRDAMLSLLGDALPQGSTYTKPDGGLFTWATLPERFNTTALLPIAREKYKVAYVPGEGFFTQGGGKGKNCIRLSFGGSAPNQIREGLERLSSLLGEQ